MAEVRLFAQEPVAEIWLFASEPVARVTRCPGLRGTVPHFDAFLCVPPIDLMSRISDRQPPNAHLILSFIKRPREESGRGGLYVCVCVCGGGMG